MTGVDLLPESGNILASVVADDARGHTLYIDFWTGASLRPGTYPLGATPAERDYDSCTVCVLAVIAGADSGSGFFATSGTLVIDSLYTASSRFAGALSEVTLVEIAIDRDTGAVEVEGGRRWCIGALDFAVASTTIR